MYGIHIWWKAESETSISLSKSGTSCKRASATRWTSKLGNSFFLREFRNYLKNALINTVYLLSPRLFNYGHANLQISTVADDTMKQTLNKNSPPIITTIKTTITALIRGIQLHYTGGSDWVHCLTSRRHLYLSLGKWVLFITDVFYIVFHL